MKDIQKMIKCRAIFLYDIATIYEDFEIIYDDRFKELLRSFLENYLINYYKYFNLIYYFSFEDDKLHINEEEEYKNELARYLKYFEYYDVKNIIRLYDDIGKDNVDMLSKLAELFCEYVMIISDMNSNKKIRN